MQGISGGILAKNKEIKKKQCYQAQVQLPTAQESNAKRQMLAKEKIALLRKLANLGTRWTHVPKNQFTTLVSAQELFKGKRKALCVGKRLKFLFSEIMVSITWFQVASCLTYDWNII